MENTQKLKEFSPQAGATGSYVLLLGSDPPEGLGTDYDGSMHVVVTYESKTGNTENAAKLIAEGLRLAGATAATFSVDAVDYGELAKADVVIVGTWCGGLFFFGQHPGGAGKIAAELPDLWDKATFAFVSYAHNPGSAAEKLGDVLEAMGAVNLGVGTIHRNRLEEDSAAFVNDVLAEFASA